MTAASSDNDAVTCFCNLFDHTALFDKMQIFSTDSRHLFIQFINHQIQNRIIIKRESKPSCQTGTNLMTTGAGLTGNADYNMIFFGLIHQPMTILCKIF